MTIKRIGLRLLDASFGLTLQIAKAYIQKKGTTTIQCARRLKRMYSIRRWYSELRLFPRQPEDVICSSDVCFGRQYPLSQPNFGLTSESRYYVLRFIHASTGFQTHRKRTPIQMQTRNMMHRCRAVVSISDCSTTTHRRGFFFPASAIALKSDCP